MEPTSIGARLPADKLREILHRTRPEPECTGPRPVPPERVGLVLSAAVMATVRAHAAATGREPEQVLVDWITTRASTG